jgi:hypothetical protein
MTQLVMKQKNMVMGPNKAQNPEWLLAKTAANYYSVQSSTERSNLGLFKEEAPFQNK